MKIACKQSNICIKSNNPNFKYRFTEADIPLEVEEAHVDKILLNSDFYKSEKDVKIPAIPEKKELTKKSWHDELIEIKGIGKKTVKDIQIVFPTKEKLLEALEKDRELPFDDDVSEKLQEVFIS